MGSNNKNETLKEGNKGNIEMTQNNCTISLLCALSSNLPRSRCLKDKSLWRRMSGLRHWVSGRESMNGSSSQPHFVLAKDAAMLKGHCWDEWKPVIVVKC